MDDSFIEIVVLLTSEVVTNAIRHGGPHAPGSEIVVRLDCSNGVVRVEVLDHNDDAPIVDLTIDVTRTSGRGMGMVHRLASSWGVGAGGHGHGKWIWFEVRT